MDGLRAARCAVVCGLASVIGCGSDRAGHSAIAAREALLGGIDEGLPVGAPDSVRGTLLPMWFDALFGAELASLKDHSDDDLTVMFSAAARAAFYSLAPEYVADMQAILEILDDHGRATKDEYLRLCRMLVSLRRFEDANRLIRAHGLSEMRELPELVDEAGGAAVTELVVEPNQHRLVRRPVSLDAPAEIVVVAHPDCHWSHDAMLAIEHDPELRRAFEHHAIWLAPQERQVDWNELEAWNTEHPAEPMALAFDRHEWPAIRSWGTPGFYFFKNGRLRSVVRGWPEGGKKTELLAALDEIGLR